MGVLALCGSSAYHVLSKRFGRICLAFLLSEVEGVHMQGCGASPGTPTTSLSSSSGGRWGCLGPLQGSHGCSWARSSTHCAWCK